MKLYFATGNKEKFREVQHILSGFDIEQIKVDVPELQGEPEDIAKEKARIACEKTGKPVFVDDTSLCSNALGGLPGPYVKDFYKKLGGVKGLYDLISRYEDRTGYAQVCVGYCAPGKQPHSFVGRVYGKFVSPAGDTRFEFDQILIAEGYTRRFSEMSVEEKNEISHRKKAFEEFKKWLLENN
jgi:inosine triphosphate pyrophosphatase